MRKKDKTNVIVVMSDTLRTAYLGCYGNREIKTANIDALAVQGCMFTQAYPESLPTIPVRRMLHTGRRAFPFRHYRPVPWDIVYLPGWQPMNDGESTVAEDLAAAGYHTGFVTDTLPYFAPAMNFTRGFWQWEFIRGQQQDRWRSIYAADPKRLENIEDRFQDNYPYTYVRCHVANTDGLLKREKTCTARAFDWACQFVEDNAEVPFYLLVDCFDPHEPWEAPQEYYRLYADGNYKDKLELVAPYARDLGGLCEEQVADIVAHYCGLVTLVDEYFGRLMKKLDDLALAGRTLVIFTSDHGTNFGDNLWHVTGKPSFALFPGTMHLPLIVRDPSGTGRGRRVNGLRYNLDVPATVYDATGVKPSQPIEGLSLLPALAGDRSGDRSYLTCRFEDTVWYFNGTWWVFIDIDGQNPHIFNVHRDPDFKDDLGGSAKEVAQVAWQRILEDAGGELPDYRDRQHTDAIGLTPVR